MNTVEKKVVDVKGFNAIVAKAVAAQGSANTLWHEATVHAVRFAASEDRNLAPMNALIKAVHGCKSLRVMSLVKFIMHLGGGETEGSLAWDAATLKLSYKKKADTIPAEAIAEAIRIPFWEHCPEKIVNISKFSDIIGAVKKVRTKADKGEALVTSDELKVLAQIEALIAKNFGTEVFEKKAK